MGIIGSLLGAPALGAISLTNWLATRLAEEAEREFLDEGAVRAGLLALQEGYDAGEVEERDYDLREKALLERLVAIREYKSRRDEGVRRRPGRNRIG